MSQARAIYAISDLHLERKPNWEAFEKLEAQPDDWLLLAGDICDSAQLFERAIETLRSRWKKLVWVPGNHELWTTSSDPSDARGEAKYRLLVDICRRAGVYTPEDDYPVWDGPGPRVRIAPLFLLYDYSFGPHGLTPDQVKAWAADHGVICTDEYLLHPDPYLSREAWCEARCRDAEWRLEAAARDGLPLILVNHFPLRADLAHVPLAPRFVAWCGTRRTENWHLRFRAEVVVTGHLHIRSTAWRDAVRFEEVSLGYPRHWNGQRGMAPYLRAIWP